MEPVDRLPFALCLDEVTGPGGEARASSRVLGNIVLADHGRTIHGERLGPVPPATLVDKARGGATRCDAAIPFVRPPRFRPSLRQRPLTHAAPYEGTPPALQGSAAEFCGRTPRHQAQSRRNEQPVHWKAKRDLLGSRPDEPHFVAEIETSGQAVLRFGDDRHARSGEPGTELVATYRIGNGPDGNIGAHAIAHVVTDESGILAVTNPLSAAGGTEPESLESVRLRAPQAFRSQQRAVTEADYAAMAGQRPDVQRAAATFRWTGSWRTVFVTDRPTGTRPRPGVRADLRRERGTVRMAGFDSEVDGPRFVSLEVEMRICVSPEYFRGHVRAALLDIFSDRVLPDGRRGLFHADTFSFGEPVYLSPMVAAAQVVAGVESVAIAKFQRQGPPDGEPLEAGRLDSAGSRSRVSTTTATFRSEVCSGWRWAAANERSAAPHRGWGSHPPAGRRLPAAAKMPPPTCRPFVNRSGLSAIAYRVGRTAFKESGIAGGTVRRPGSRRLDGLTTRQDDDFAIALLDAWAAVCDVIRSTRSVWPTSSTSAPQRSCSRSSELARLIELQAAAGRGRGDRPGVHD